MKTVDQLSGRRATLFHAGGETSSELILSADTLGIWTAENVFTPWAAIDRIEVAA